MGKFSKIDDRIMILADFFDYMYGANNIHRISMMEGRVLADVFMLYHFPQ